MPAYPADEGVYIIEEKSGDVLQAQNAGARYAPASTTKLMTALVLAETMNDAFDQTVTVGDEVKDFDYSDSTAGLYPGQQLTYNDLLYALLLPSGNDAAETIAVNVGKKLLNDPSADKARAISAFVDAMNKEAEKLGLKDTHFVNAHGRYDPGHYTTPEDMAVIAREAFSHSAVKQAASTKTYTLTHEDGTPNVLKNTNVMLFKDAGEYGEVISESAGQANPYYTMLVDAAKTGFTDEGGRTFVFSSAENGAEMIGVLFKTQDHNLVFEQAKQVLDETNANYGLKSWSAPDGAYEDVAAENIHFRDGKSIPLTGAQQIYSFAPKNEVDHYQAKIVWDGKNVAEEDGKPVLKQNVAEGTQVAELEISNAGKSVKTVPLYTARELRIKDWTDFIVDNSVWFGLGLLAVIALIVWIVRRRRAEHFDDKNRKDAALGNHNKTANRL